MPRGFGRGGRGRGGRNSRNHAAFAAGAPLPSSAPQGAPGSSSTAVADAAVPTEDQVDASLTLQQLRQQEATIMAATRTHEDALGRLQNLYKRVRAKMYRDHKSAVIAEDNAKLQRFQGGCPKPKEVASKEELDAQAKCMQKEAREIDNSDLGLLMRRHLKGPVPPLPAGATCAPFRQVDASQLSARTRGCLARVGDARWTAEGLVDAPPGQTAAGDAPSAAASAASAASAAAATPPPTARAIGWGPRRRGACWPTRTSSSLGTRWCGGRCTRSSTCSRGPRRTGSSPTSPTSSSPTATPPPSTDRGSGTRTT